MELQLELGISPSLGKGLGPNQDCEKMKKRSFDEAFLGINKNVVDVPQTLPLFTWDDEIEKQINAQLHDQKHNHKLAVSNRNANFGDDFVVGWPPVKSWRKQFCYHTRQGCAANYVNVENGGRGGRGSSSMYVKVKMEGVGIARKVDLRNHHSYQSLAAKLISLFEEKLQANVEMYKLTYQDTEGDWLLAGDVPWETFIKSVRRLKLQKNGY